MAAIVFTLGEESITLDDPRSFPTHDPYRPNIVTGMSDGRKMYAYHKGGGERDHYLVLTGSQQDDYDALKDWYETVSIGAQYEFVYADHDEAEHTVRWVDEAFPIQRVGPNEYAGTIHLREEL